jgi:hypothetical protein
MAVMAFGAPSLVRRGSIPRIFVVTLLQQGQSPTGLAYDLVLLRT